MSGRLIRVHGLIQGVGFRPYVWRLARELGLDGWVRNDGAGVTIAVDGHNLAEFMRRLPAEIPRLARIDELEESACSKAVQSGFAILDSEQGDISTSIGPDSALCPYCIADLCDPDNRRWRYAFTTCTHCGPRYSVSRRIPYDRAQTSLASFPLCPDCDKEYTSAVDRRFHAETTCCPTCGPRLQFLSADGLTVAGDPICLALSALQNGQIIALKGMGGFHLACDAGNPVAVAELRQRKQREEKPFAVMGLNTASLADHAQISADEASLLNSLASPIVLCKKTMNELPGIAPRLDRLGVMLPTTPLHLLLWHQAVERPAGTAWMQQKHPLLLVMTSANPHGEPLVTGNEEAMKRLHGIADGFLLHNRDIVAPSDDSLIQATTTGPSFIRRARGFVPLPIHLAEDGPTVLALGGYLKNTICVVKGKQAFLSQHIGSLDNAATLGFLEKTVEHLLHILDVQPEHIAHDLHPDYPSTHLALKLAERFGIPALPVPHHQAHLAAIAAEHQVEEPFIGLALDGIGLGPDHSAWGGELLRLDGATCTRLGHLSPLAQPGGDRAAREPWRMAVAALHAAGLGYRVGGWLKQYYPERDAGQLLILLERKLRCPPSTSLGRWFDAAAGLLGLRDVMHYEGQAAMELEALARQHGPVAPISNGYLLHPETRVLDFSPLLPALLGCKDDAARGAALFHATVAAGLAKWALSAVDPDKSDKIVVGGGCAMNTLLMSALREHLAAECINLFEARQAPPNDGGLALGQAWVARQTNKERSNVSGDSRPSH